MKRKIGFWRSGYERQVREQLDRAGVSYQYEPFSIKWRRNVSKGRCGDCGGDEVYQDCDYTPDFVLASGIWIEAKGILDGPDRTKLKALKKQHPKIDLRLVFQRDNPIKGTKNKTRYSEWARQFGFQFAIKEVPASWLS